MLLILWLQGHYNTTEPSLLPVSNLRLQDWTGAGFSNILDYQKIPILIQVLTGNFMQPALRDVHLSHTLISS